MKNHTSVSHFPLFIPSLPKQFHWKIYGHVVHQQKKKWQNESLCPGMCSGHALTTLETEGNMEGALARVLRHGLVLPLVNSALNALTAHTQTYT